jgi:hypothetical protein
VAETAAGLPNGCGAVLSVLRGNLSAMEPDDRAATWLLANQRGVISREQVLASGVTEEGLRHRLRRGGTWQRLLPGVYLTVTGQPTREQQQIAALLYGGPASIITGPAALRNYGIRGPETEIVDLLVPARRQRANRQFVVIHRTTRMPRQWTSDGPLRFALAARAVADAVREIGKRPDAAAGRPGRGC